MSNGSGPNRRDAWHSTLARPRLSDQAFIYGGMYFAWRARVKWENFGQVQKYALARERDPAVGKHADTSADTSKRERASVEWHASRDSRLFGA